LNIDKFLQIYFKLDLNFLARPNIYNLSHVSLFQIEGFVTIEV